MRKLLTAALLLAVAPLFADPPTSSSSGVATRFVRRTSDPATCTFPQVMGNTTTSLFKGCTATNVWSSFMSLTGGTLTTSATNDVTIKLATTAPSALTATIAAGAGVTAGTHSYKVTFITASGETSAGSISNTVTTAAGNLQVNLTAIPIGPIGIVTSRKIYRTAAGNAVTGPWLLQSTIANNTATTLSDNTADASLTTAIPSTNTTLDARLTVNNDGTLTTGGFTTKNGAANACYVTSDQTNATVTMASTTCEITGLIAGRKYGFECVLLVDDSTSGADAIQFDLAGGTATETNLRAGWLALGASANDAMVVDDLTDAFATDTAPFGVSDDIEVRVAGGFEPSGAGTFLPRFAQVNHTVGTATLYRGSSCRMWDIP